MGSKQAFIQLIIFKAAGHSFSLRRIFREFSALKQNTRPIRKMFWPSSQCFSLRLSGFAPTTFIFIYVLSRTSSYWFTCLLHACNELLTKINYGAQSGLYVCIYSTCYWSGLKYSGFTAIFRYSISIHVNQLPTHYLFSVVPTPEISIDFVNCLGFNFDILFLNSISNYFAVISYTLKTCFFLKFCATLAISFSSETDYSPQFSFHLHGCLLVHFITFQEI